MRHFISLTMLLLPLSAVAQEEDKPKEEKPKFTVTIITPDGKMVPVNPEKDNQEKKDVLDNILHDLKSGNTEEAYRKILDILARIQDPLNDSKEKLGSDEAELLKTFLKQIVQLRVKRFVKDSASSDSKVKEKAMEELLGLGDEILGLLEAEKGNDEARKAVELIKTTKDQVLKLIETLGVDEAEKRQQAHDQLLKLGKKAKPYLRQFRNDSDQERKSRVNSILDELEKRDKKTSSTDDPGKKPPIMIIGKSFIFKDEPGKDKKEEKKEEK